MLLSGSTKVPQDPSDSQIPHATVAICCSTPGSLRQSDTLCYCRALLQYPRIPQTLSDTSVLQYPGSLRHCQIPCANVRICCRPPGSLRHCQIPCATVRICCSTRGSLRHLSDTLCYCQGDTVRYLVLLSGAAAGSSVPWVLETLLRYLVLLSGVATGCSLPWAPPDSVRYRILLLGAAVGMQYPSHTVTL